MNDKGNSFRIRNFSYSSQFIAGPMASLSDFVLRELIAGFGGAACLFTEMLDCRRIITDRNIEENPRFKRDSYNTPTFFQIFGSKKDDIINAVNLIKGYLREGDAIDINMGCSAPKIKKQSAGIKLMEKEAQSHKLIQAIRDVYDGLLTVKLRTGADDDINYTINFVKDLENSGVDAVTYHPRISSQKLRNRANWQHISKLKDKVSIPLIGNGDIFSVDDAMERLLESNADAYMLSRASAISPWIFKNIQQSLHNETLKKPDLLEVWNFIFNGILKYYSEQEARIRINRYVEYFARNFSFGHVLWKKVINSSSLIEIEKIAEQFISNNI